MREGPVLTQNSAATTALNNLISLRPSTFTQAKISQVITDPSLPTQNTGSLAQTPTPPPQCRRQTRYAQPLNILFFSSWPLSERKQNSQPTRQPEIKFRKSFCTTGARNLGVPNLLLHLPIKLDSNTHFHTCSHVMAELKHLRSKILSWNRYLKRHDRIWSAKGGNHGAFSRTRRSYGTGYTTLLQ